MDIRRRRVAGGRRALAAVLALALGGSALGAIPSARASASPHDSASATSSAASGPLGARQASARAKATGRAVPVDALTTPSSQTAANPDGTYTLTETATPPAPGAAPAGRCWTRRCTATRTDRSARR